MLLIRTAVLRAVDTAASRLRSFQNDERGAIIVLTLFLFLAMVLVTGVAIDIVRTEHARTKLQGTLDRAVLAAADLENELDPKAVVLDYFAKAGLSSYINADALNADDDLNTDDGIRRITYRSIEGAVSANVPTMFLNRVGINSLPAPAAAGATEGATPVEIVLVLDVSGSMNFRLDADVNATEDEESRLEALQEAAEEFVDLIYERPENADRVAIAIVPYAWNVNFDAAKDDYGRAIGSPNTGCLSFTEADFNSRTILPGAAHPRTGFADSFSTRSSSSPQGPNRGGSNWDCQPIASQFVLPYTNDIEDLKEHIEDLTAGGSTSIEVGMKWGAHMIDPSYRTVNQAMVNDGLTPAQFSQVPRDYGQAATKKYIVLMSDGQNMPSFELAPQYRSGTSPIYRGRVDTNGDGVLDTTRYSFRDETRATDQYYRQSDAKYYSTAEGTTSTVVRLTWEQVWEELRVGWVVRELYTDRLLGNNTTASINEYSRTFGNIVANYNGTATSVGDSTTFVTRVEGTEKDTRLNNVCSSVKDQEQVNIYTIAFRSNAIELRSEADFVGAHRGDVALGRCASNYLTHHFPAQNADDLNDAFSAIASRITEIRLTQ
ncbi:MAG: pilus assembly protein TadG-related protein [Rhodobacteraceae bacterium]|jgi:hypothetical protein|nr:pilus assembly protein TadG-related protein [Paracoccaceae bacterium]